MNKATLLLGGNQGDRRHLIQQATELIRQRVGSVVASSSIHETEPWGTFVDSSEFGVRNSEVLEPVAMTPHPAHRTPNFLNQALLVETELTAHEVLEEALVIEAVLGRLRPATPQTAVHGIADLPQRIYHSRPMDIDLIFFNDEVIDEPDLQIPHPRMHLRRFVLEPLAEIMPDYRHPVLGLTVRQLLERNPILNTVTSEVLKN